MQIVNVSGNSAAANYQDLCDKLTQYGTGYFDRYEFDETNVKVDCYLGDDVALSIKYDNSYGITFTYSQNEYQRYTSSYYKYITRLIVCDNCIGFIVDQNYGGGSPYWYAPTFFAKKTDGSIVFVYPSPGTYASSIDGINVWSSSTFYGGTVGVISFDATTHEGRKNFVPVASVNLQSVPGADTTRIDAMQLYDPYDGAAIKDLYFITASGATQLQPGYFSVDSVRYVGMGRYTFASKENS